MDIDYSTNWQPKITVRAQGRGAGKTYAVSRWLAEKALNHPQANIAVVASRDTREYLIEHIINAGNELGLSSEFVRSRLWISFSNGAKVKLYHPERPDTLRGPTHDFLAGDDVHKWSDSVFFDVTSSCRPITVGRAEMWMNFAGTTSPHIADLLQNGFEAKTG